MFLTLAAPIAVDNSRAARVTSPASRSTDFRFDDWGVDVAVTGSQKGFMPPAGLLIVGFSPTTMLATKTAPV